MPEVAPRPSRPPSHEEANPLVDQPGYRSAARPDQPPTARPYIGGQAVMEGVMMRSPTSFAIVVRRVDGSLHVRERGMRDGRSGAARIPFVRGVASLVESLKLGGEALRFSGELLERDWDARERAKAEKAALKTTALRMLNAIGYTLFLLMTADGDPGALPTDPEKGEKGEKSEEAAAEEKRRGPMGLMLVVMVAFLIALPQAAAAGVNRLFNLHYAVQSAPFQAITGAFKLTIVIGYLLFIRSVLADIRRVFQYHGAEHKTISTYEARQPLTVENARMKTTLHPRCGTTFLVMVALVSIVLFTVLGSVVPRFETGSELLDNVCFFLIKLPFLPVIAAITFEIQRVFARYCTTGPLRVLLWPGFLCQKITTIEPDDDQLEVALASLRVTLFREEAKEAAATATPDVRYKDFDALMKSPRLRRG